MLILFTLKKVFYKTDISIILKNSFVMNFWVDIRREVGGSNWVMTNYNSVINVLHVNGIRVANK